jgi:TolA-binding protein
MSQKTPYTPMASDEPVYEIDSFEMLWEQHKGKIIGGAVAAIVVIVGIFGWLIVTNNQRTSAEKAFGAARTAAEYQAVIQQFPSQPVSGSATLLLAASLRGEKKYDEANQVLEQFVKAQPEHPFAPLAKVDMAMNLALAGKTDDAEKTLGGVAQADGKSFAAPFALLLEAEMKSAQNNREEALKAYRELSKTFPESIATRASAPAYQALASLFPPAPAASPAPAPAAP